MKTRSKSQGARICLEVLESRYAPAKLLGPDKLTYQDKDGDTVVVSFTKPILDLGDPNKIFAFDSGPGAVNGTTFTRERLIRIDLTSIPTAANGVSISTRATPSDAGGDGFATVSQINATGTDLGIVKIDGDVGGVRAKNLKSLTIQSIRPYDSYVTTLIEVDLGSLIVKGDVNGDIEVDGHLNSLKIGGSLVGSSGGLGQILVAKGLRTATIAGNVEGASAINTGFINVASPSPANYAIESLTIGGSVIGGSKQGTGDLLDSGLIRADGIKKLAIGGSIIAGTDATTGQYFGNGAVISNYAIGSMIVRGSLIGNSTNPAVIAAAGRQNEQHGTDVAIGSLTIYGRVDRGLIEAGVMQMMLPNQSVDADAQIGSIRVGGDWIASSIAAGAVAGPSGFGTSADVKMSGAGIRDDATVSSSIGSVTIAGEILGTFGGTDHFGFVAERIGSVRVGGIALQLLVGKGNDDIVVGITGDFDARELR